MSSFFLPYCFGACRIPGVAAVGFGLFFVYTHKYTSPIIASIKGDVSVICRGRSLGCPTSLEVGYGPCGRQTPPRVLRNEGSAPLFECYCRGRSGASLPGRFPKRPYKYRLCAVLRGRQTPWRVLRNEGSASRSFTWCPAQSEAPGGIPSLTKPFIELY
jgi:hypothetical protein